MQQLGFDIARPVLIYNALTQVSWTATRYHDDPHTNALSFVKQAVVGRPWPSSSTELDSEYCWWLLIGFSYTAMVITGRNCLCKLHLDQPRCWCWHTSRSPAFAEDISLAHQWPLSSVDKVCTCLHRYCKVGCYSYRSICVSVYTYDVLLSTKFCRPFRILLTLIPKIKKDCI